MRIIQFMASQQWGGAEKVFVEVANELAANHQVTALLLRDTEYRHRFSPNVKVVDLHSHPTRRNPFLLLELYRVIKKIKPDVIHTHGAKAAELLHNLAHFVRVNHLATKHNARTGRIFNKLPWVTAVSEEAAKSIRSRGRAEIRVVNNGIRPQHPVGSGSPSKDDLFSICAIGRLDRIKGFDLLIDQVQRLPFAYRLSIYGDGPERRNLQRLIDRLGLAGRVVLEGFCENIPAVMHLSDLVVISSQSEGFPKVMVEALFYAKALVSTPVSGVTEVVPPPFLAEQPQLATKITEVQANYDWFVQQFAQLKNERANDFLLPKVVGKYEAVYTEMLAGSS